MISPITERRIDARSHPALRAHESDAASGLRRASVNPARAALVQDDQPLRPDARALQLFTTCARASLLVGSRVRVRCSARPHEGATYGEACSRGRCESFWEPEIPPGSEIPSAQARRRGGGNANRNR